MTDRSGNNTDETWKNSPFAPGGSAPQREEKDRSPVEEKLDEFADRVEALNERVDEANSEQSKEKIWEDSPFGGGDR